MNSERHQTFINLFTGIFSMAVTLLINFFLSSFIVRELGEEANGFTQLANNFVTYASLITIAFNSMASRFISFSYHQGNVKKTNHYYSSIMICDLLLTLLMIPVAYYVVLHLDHLVKINNANVTHVKILFACVFISYFINLFVSVYSIATFVLNKIYIQNIINAIRVFSNGLLLLVVFCFLEPKIYYVSMCSMLLTAIVLPLFIVIQKRLMPELRFSFHYFNLKAVADMLKSGIWNTVNQGGNMLMTGLDLLLANLFISPAMMGVLSVSKVFPNAIVMLGTTLNANFMPEIVIQYSKKETGALLRSLRSNMKISSVIMSIPIMTFCCFGIPFYRLWVPSLDPKLLTILSFLTCMAFVPSAGTQTLHNVFTATNHLKVNSVSFLISGFINVVVVYYLLSNTDLGVFAIAGVSSIITILRNLIVTIPYTALILDLPWYEFYKDILISLACCTLNYIVAKGVMFIISNNGWISLFISIMITCCLSLTLDMYLVLNKAERKKLLSKFRR